ncbi:MAG TPA: tRNA 2-thiocytidine biosynthesis protein TtcA [Thiothrix sp.]|nr:tRNA 2-thiocytidine biosynthesis protein TtcA [Thiothrix sp.]
MTKLSKPPKSLLRQTGKALVDFSMINEGDRVLLGLSGGKDSLALLHILRHFQRHAPIRFELGAVTVDPMADSFDPSALIPYMQQLGVDYHYCKEPIVELAEKHLDNRSFCSFCARMKRGIIYGAARKHGYNVIALAQHLDDLAESFLMSAFHGGKLNTMKANYVVNEGDLRVIRPLVYVRERQTVDFSHVAQLPIISENCPACFAAPTQREHMKQLLAQEEKQNPTLFKSLQTAMLPLMKLDNQQRL